jgi:hypothetical protein
MRSGAKGDLDQLLALCRPVLDKDSKQRWALLPEPRIAALRAGGLLADALNANKRPTDGCSRRSKPKCSAGGVRSRPSRSIERREPAGALALKLEIPPQNTVTAAWSEFLLRGGDGEVTTTLAYVLKAHAELVTAPFMNAMAALMLGSLGIRREVASPVVAVREWGQATRLRPRTRVLLACSAPSWREARGRR